jgi:hypothetical protein
MPGNLKVVAGRALCSPELKVIPTLPLGVLYAAISGRDIGEVDDR